MEKYIINNINYELIKNEREGFNEEAVTSKLTDFFYNYDYVVGDWAYGKLRLKGFYSPNNKLCTNINNIENVDKYITNNCAYGCKHFILKKIVIEN